MAARAGVPVEYRERVQGSLPHLLVIGEGFAVNDLPQVVYLVPVSYTHLTLPTIYSV